MKRDACPAAACELRCVTHMAELYSAAYHGNVNSIRRLIRGGADLHWRHPHGGATALYVACEFGHAEAAKTLLEGETGSKLSAEPSRSAHSEDLPQTPSRVV